MGNQCPNWYFWLMSLGFRTFNFSRSVIKICNQPAQGFNFRHSPPSPNYLPPVNTPSLRNFFTYDPRCRCHEVFLPSESSNSSLSRFSRDLHPIQSSCCSLMEPRWPVHLFRCVEFMSGIQSKIKTEHRCLVWARCGVTGEGDRYGHLVQ